MKFPQTINVLLLGGGGREHAIAVALARSPRLGKLYIAPGNAGTAAVGENIDIDPDNFGAVKKIVLSQQIGLVVVGPELPLVHGITDFFHDDSELAHVPIVGPSAAGARLEGSKDFAKAFMMRYGIPTAAYRSFTKTELAQATAFLATMQPPYVLKADGLAAGKGVLIVPTLAQAEQELADMLSGKFGTAGNRVVIEQFLSGIECSVFVATDGTHYSILPVAKDYKRVGDGDTGLNTGGMGAVSPVPFADATFMSKVEKRIVIPTIKGIAAENLNYKGFIFLGLINVAGEPYVIEYNVRMGDPETEVVMPRITSDLVAMCEAICFGSLDKYHLTVADGFATTVMCTSGGYPQHYDKGFEITGLDRAAKDFGVEIYHAGTQSIKGKVVTSGGRVLCATAVAPTLDGALSRSYGAVESLSYNGKYFRKDIGADIKKML